MWWDEVATIEEKRRLVQRHIERIVVHPSGKGGRGFWLDRYLDRVDIHWRDSVDVRRLEGALWSHLASEGFYDVDPSAVAEPIDWEAFKRAVGE